MKKYLLFIFCMISAVSAFADAKGIAGGDTSSIIELNTQGFTMRLTSPEQTIADGKKALEMAQRIKYVRGMAESNRIIGIGYYYMDESVKAINYYLTSLNYFIQLKDLASQG